MRSSSIVPVLDEVQDRSIAHNVVPDQDEDSTLERRDAILGPRWRSHHLFIVEIITEIREEIEERGDLLETKKGIEKGDVMAE